MAGPWEDYASGPWNDYAKPKAALAKPKAAQVKPSGIMDSLAHIASPLDLVMSKGKQALLQNGALAGFSDRLAGASRVIGNAIAAPLSDKVDFNPAKAYNEGFSQHRTTVRNARKAEGVGGTIAEAAGSLVPMLMAGNPATLGRSLAQSGAIGSVFGAGESNDLTNGRETLSNMGSGAMSAVTGDLLGRGLVKVAGKVLAPKLAQKVAPAGSDYKKAVQLLANEGVDIMPGQAMGPLAKRLEEKAMSAPIYGDAIRLRAGKQVEQLNAAAINRALKPLGKQLPKGATGKSAMAHMQSAFNDAYDTARSGMVFEDTPQFSSSLDNLVQSAEGDPLLSQDHVARFSKVIDNLRNRSIGPSGVMTGDVFKKTLSDLKTQSSKLMAGGNSASDQQLGSYLKELVDHIDEAARTNPASNPAAVALMDKADEGYAMAIRIEDAAKRRGGEPGTFTAGQLDAAVQKADKSARNRAYLRGNALMQDLSNAGEMVLAPKVPNSGTWDRAMANSPAAWAAMAHPGALAGYATALPFYIPGALTRRPDVLLRAGKAADKLAAPAGVLGAAALLGNR